MEEIVFKPWVGEDYFKKEKIMILGESHYGNPDGKDENFTSFIVNRFLKYKKGEVSHEAWMRTFTRFTNIIHNKRCNNEEIFDFWNSVIFYNYIQKLMPNSRIKPEPELLNKSYNPFLSIVEKYKPSVIFVWGLRLWGYLPKNRIFYEKRADKFFLYIENFSVEMIKMYHPASSKLTYSYWQKRNSRF